MISSSFVSVIIPNWNGAHHLPVCLDALGTQTYPYIEVILVDNASTDRSPEFLAELAAGSSSLHFIRNTENRGFASANFSRFPRSSRSR